jgi:hypothetical protein
MERQESVCRWVAWGVGVVLIVSMLCGCAQEQTGVSGPVVPGERRVFELREIAAGKAEGFLSELGLGAACVAADGNAVAVTGSVGDLYRAGVLLELVDTRDEFVIETLAPVAEARSIPTNSQIADALGGITVGTFANPPKAGEHTRAIIDIHGNSVVAILPARIHRELVAFVRLYWGQSPISAWRNR